MERNFDWFTQRRRARGLQLAHDQITKAFETVPLRHQTAQSFAEGNIKEAKTALETLYANEEVVDQLRTNTFLELSKGAALVADYREDLLHLVKRADMLADYTKHAARCFGMLAEADIPQELCNKTLVMTGKLVQIVGILRNGLMGRPIFGSTFDPLDIAAYAGGVSLGVLLDMFLLPRLVPR